MTGILNWMGRVRTVRDLQTTKLLLRRSLMNSFIKIIQGPRL
jgi:hypothetical protein